VVKSVKKIHLVTSKCLVKAPKYHTLKNQYANGVLVCIFLKKALIRFETTIPPK
jgi:hypothetical protein